MSTIELNDDIQELVSQGTESVAFQDFAEKLFTLAPQFTQIYDDESLRQRYFSGDFESKTALLPEEIVSTVKGVYDSFCAHIKSTHDLAVNIYRLSELTGKTYDEVAKVLNEAFNRKLNKSYISKLYRAGRLLCKIPELQQVTDVEKLATLANIPEPELRKSLKVNDDVVLVGDMNVAKTSRGTLTETFKAQYPHHFKSRPQTVAPKVDYISDLKAALVKAQPHIGSEPALATKVQECINLIESLNSQ